MRSLVATTATCLLLTALVACGGGGDDKSQTDVSGALEQATDSCNAMLTASGDDDAIVKAGSDAADVAAKAANSDPKWDDLATAISNLAKAQSDIADLTKRAQAGEDITAALTLLLSQNQDQAADLVAQCRKVLAAGGEVDESALSSY